MNLEYLTNETLLIKRADYLERIEQLEQSYRQSKSVLFMMSVSASIKNLQRKIHKIEAELAYRGVKE